MDRSNIIYFILLSEYMLDDAAAGLFCVFFWFRKYDYCTYRQESYIYQVINLSCQENPYAHASQDVMKSLLHWPQSTGCLWVVTGKLKSLGVEEQSEEIPKSLLPTLQENVANGEKNTCFQIQFLKEAQLKWQMQWQSQASPWLQKK